MAVSLCIPSVDRNRKELLQHGTEAYPLACYHDHLAEESVPWHWHEELELVRVDKGETVLAIGEAQFLVREGEGYFVNAGVLHSCRDHANSGCRFHSLVFHSRLIGGSAESFFYQRYLDPLTGDKSVPGLILRPEVPWQSAALELVERAWQANCCESADWELESRECMSRVVALLCAHALGKGKTADLRSVRQRERMKQMLDHIASHLGEPLTVAQIAASASISESECLRCFRSMIHTTPICYLRSCRIQQAAALLASTQDKISDIAARCGFEDMSYFSRQFRLEKGCTPSHYRRNFQGAEEKA